MQRLYFAFRVILRWSLCRSPVKPSCIFPWGCDPHALPFTLSSLVLNHTACYWGSQCWLGRRWRGLSATLLKDDPTEVRTLPQAHQSSMLPFAFLKRKSDLLIIARLFSRSCAIRGIIHSTDGWIWTTNECAWVKGLSESLTLSMSNLVSFFFFFYLQAKGNQRLDHKVNKKVPTKIRSIYNYLFAVIYSLNLFQHCKWVLLRNAHCSSAWECFYAMDTSKSPQMEFCRTKNNLSGSRSDTWYVITSLVRNHALSHTAWICSQVSCHSRSKGFSQVISMRLIWPFWALIHSLTSGKSSASRQFIDL